MEPLNIMHEKRFSIIETGDINTIIYRVDKIVDPILKYTLERLDYVIEFEIEGKRKRTFFINDLHPDGNTIVIFTFTNGRIDINTAIVDGKKVLPSKKMIPLKTKVLHNDKETIFDEFRFNEDLKRETVVLDLDTLEELKPVLFLDENTQTVKEKVILEEAKSYFEFEIINDKKNNENTSNV